MIKIRVIRKTTDVTTILWIGCIASELARAFPVGSGSEPDQLSDCFFEGFANGAWLEISDPRTNRVPTSESELQNSDRDPCKRHRTADNVL